MSKLTSERARELGRRSSRKGVKNKTTEEVRAKFNQLLSDNLENLQRDLDALEPHQRVRMLLELAKYVIPTLKSTEITDTNPQSVKPVIISFTEGAKRGYIKGKD